MITYGPLPSRRFGLSLGIDLFRRKRCPLDCLYCQLGPTERCETDPVADYRVAEVLEAVAQAVARGPRPDVLTLAGSGEPLLYAHAADLIDGLHARWPDLPVLLISNGLLLWRPEAARAAMAADLFAPSVDAGDEATWRRINRPADGIDFTVACDSLRRVCDAHQGLVRVEVMLLRGINDSDESLAAIAALIGSMRHDAIDVNTPVRPSIPERGAVPPDPARLAKALAVLGPKASLVGELRSRPAGFDEVDKMLWERLVAMPSSRTELADRSGVAAAELNLRLERLQAAGLVRFDDATERFVGHQGGGPRLVGR